jgi:hypothetical protein
MGQTFERVVFNLPAQMSRFSSFFELEGEIGGNDPGFKVSILLSFRVVLNEEEDVHGNSGELCAGFLHGPGTPPFGIEATFLLRRIERRAGGGEQRFGILQHIAKQSVIGLFFMGVRI